MTKFTIKLLIPMVTEFRFKETLKRHKLQRTVGGILDKTCLYCFISFDISVGTYVNYVV